VKVGVGGPWVMVGWIFENQRAGREVAGSECQTILLYSWYFSRCCSFFLIPLSFTLVRFFSKRSEKIPHLTNKIFYTYDYKPDRRMTTSENRGVWDFGVLRFTDCLCKKKGTLL